MSTLPNNTHETEKVETLTPGTVLRPPSHTVMPHAFRVLVIAIKSKFRLDAALPEAQLELGNQVPWDATFVKDIRSGLMAVKVW